MSPLITLYPLWLAACIDLALGEPPNRMHPVVWMGQLIAALRRWAPRQGRIRALLYGGADLTLQGDDGKVPLDLALEAGHTDAAKILQEGITKQFRLKRE